LQIESAAKHSRNLAFRLLQLVQSTYPRTKSSSMPERNKSAASGQPGLVPLKGSERKMPAGRNIGAAPAHEIIEVSLRLRRRSAMDSLLKEMRKGRAPLTRTEYEQQFGSAREDLDQIEAFARSRGLTILSYSLARRTVVLKGRIQDFSNAFGVHLSHYQLPDGSVYRGRMGFISIPAELEPLLQAVFGLDNRPQARPMFHRAVKGNQVVRPRDSSTSFAPIQMGQLYNYPAQADGSGQCIGLIELGGGFRQQDMEQFFSGAGLALPAITAQSVDGAVNSPSTADSADGEVALDIEVAGSIAPQAKIVVYFAPNTDQGFLDAITSAIHDDINRPSVVSISWGSAESDWTQQAMDQFDQSFQSAAALGVTITVAAGDNGSSDGQTDGKAHVDFPASSPNVLACGGTRLTATAETVWNDGNGNATGGGISDIFPVPDYQAQTKLPASVNAPPTKGRGVPDVAANADAETGYQVLVDGESMVIGGTSAVAPLMAGLLARCNQQLGRPVGFVNPKIYTVGESPFKDITVGNNITAKDGGYSAAKGWDACTGLGVPLGSLVNFL
jgi:kumamolisin